MRAGRGRGDGTDHRKTKLTNRFEEDKFIRCGMLVDTGAGALRLPKAWKERLGKFKRAEAVELQLANQGCSARRSLLAGGDSNQRLSSRLERSGLRRHGVGGGRRIRTASGGCHPRTRAGCGRHARTSPGSGEIHRHEVGTSRRFHTWRHLPSRQDTFPASGLIVAIELGRTIQAAPLQYAEMPAQRWTWTGRTIAR